MKHVVFVPHIQIAGSLLAVLITCSSTIAAEPEAPAPDLAAGMQNPIGAIYSLPLEITTDFGAPDGSATFIQIQPVYPISLGEWNLVNRTIIPFINAPGGLPGHPGNPDPEPGARATGLGDTLHTSFFSPAKAGKVIWGVGPAINLPTATKDVLGSGKWSAGPSVVFLTMPKPWVLGVLVGNLWSFAGDADRNDVNQLIVQPFITYNMEGGWFLTTSPMNTANWNATSDQRWLLPLGGGVGKQFKVAGKIPSQFMVQYFSNVTKPDGAPDGSVRFTFQMAFPK
jgi:hypothetical protein